MKSFKDYYAILGIEFSATETDIKTGYRKMARLFHPDMHPEDTQSYTAKFQEITEAYETLSDAYKKETYDQQYRYSVSGEMPIAEAYYYDPEYQYEHYEVPVESKRKSYASYAVFLFMAIYVIRMISSAATVTSEKTYNYAPLPANVQQTAHFPNQPKDTLDFNTMKERTEPIKRPF